MKDCLIILGVLVLILYVLDIDIINGLLMFIFTACLLILNDRMENKVETLSKVDKTLCLDKTKKCNYPLPD